MSKKTTAMFATAGFAIFAAPALADRPENPGQQGRDTAAQKQAEAEERKAERAEEREARAEEREAEREERKAAREDDESEDRPEKAKKAKRAKGVGFTLAGTGLTGALPVADGALTGPLTLDVLSANKHARTLLGLSKAEIAGDDTAEAGTAGDEVVVKLDGLSSTDELQATDRVKLIGKVTRVRKGDESTVRSLDIRKIVVTRAAEDDDAQTEPEPETDTGSEEQAGS